MIGQAQFTYTDEDMIAAQHAGWTRFARWRNFFIAFVGIAVLECAILAGLNAAYGTRGAPTDFVFVLIVSATLTVSFFGLMLWVARQQGRDVLRSRKHGMPWNGDELRGEHAWSWDTDELRISDERKRANLSWTSVGAWLDAPEVLLLFPSGGRPFSLSERTLASEWKDAPKVFLYPAGGFALVLPKRALAAGDAGRLIEVLRTAGAQERRQFGSVAARTSAQTS